MHEVRFEWDSKKNALNQQKHGISFYEAQHAFIDPKRVVARDVKHQASEDRYYCIGKVDGEIMTVRFTYRNDIIRIFGAGYWRVGKKVHEKTNNIYG